MVTLEEPEQYVKTDFCSFFLRFPSHHCANAQAQERSLLIYNKEEVKNIQIAILIKCVTKIPKVFNKKPVQTNVADELIISFTGDVI